MIRDQGAAQAAYDRLKSAQRTPTLEEMEAYRKGQERNRDDALIRRRLPKVT